jgi:hypothetical protein
MKTLNRLSDRAYNFASKQTFFFLLFCLVVVLFTMQIGTNGMKKFDSAAEMLDMSKLGYSAAMAYGLLENLGSTGRLIYIQQLGIDFLFAVVYALFQSVMISGLLKRGNVDEKWHPLNLLPFLRSAFDVVENCFLLSIIFQYPARLAGLINIASTLTVIKWVVYGAVMITLFSLGASTVMKTMASKKLSMKASKS